ncbi:hypothetical protein AAG570_000022 [Ranatra chinensis]|uniref:Uncharacterized protein n=1 Tax=Ranatra chinensis TaxID=642074 RepID=A0ABD0YVV9_9HEMI
MVEVSKLSTNEVAVNDQPRTRAVSLVPPQAGRLYCECYYRVASCNTPVLFTLLEHINGSFGGIIGSAMLGKVCLGPVVRDLPGISCVNDSGTEGHFFIMLHAQSSEHGRTGRSPGLDGAEGNDGGPWDARVSMNVEWTELAEKLSVMGGGREALLSAEGCVPSINARQKVDSPAQSMEARSLGREEDETKSQYSIEIVKRIRREMT